MGAQLGVICKHVTLVLERVGRFQVLFPCGIIKICGWVTNGKQEKDRMTHRVLVSTTPRRMLKFAKMEKIAKE